MLNLVKRSIEASKALVYCVSSAVFIMEHEDLDRIMEKLRKIKVVNNIVCASTHKSLM